MREGIVNVQEMASAAAWRRPEQLRGLLRNHVDLVASCSPLATSGVLFSSVGVALHDSEDALAVALNPLMGSGSVGLLPLTDSSVRPGLTAVPRMRWLDLPGDTRSTCVAWCDDLLLLGSSRGRILVADLPVAASTESSGLLQPCGALLTGTTVEDAVGAHVVAPSAQAHTTLVRSVQINAAVNKSGVAAVRGTQGFVWDLNGGAAPVRLWSPHRDSNAATVLLFVRWAPQSDSVLLTGSYDGSLLLVDTRSSAGHAFCFNTRSSLEMVSCAAFNPTVPHILAAASSDGTVSLFDMRYGAQSVQAFPCLQGDAVALQWLPPQPDMLMTAGTDGSVSMWNLRCPPTFCVGRAQYGAPMLDLVTTSTFLEQRGFGLTLTGDLTLTGLRQEAMMALAPQPASAEMAQMGLVTGRPNAASVGGEALEAVGVTAAAEQRQACGYLYTLQMKEAYRQVTRCAMDCFAARATRQAMRLVSLLDTEHVPLFDYERWLERGVVARQDDVADGSAARAELGRGRRDDFGYWLLQTAGRRCDTMALHRLRGLSAPDAQDIRRLEALRLNVLLQGILQMRDTGQIMHGIAHALQVLAAHTDSFELVDLHTVCAIIRLVLHRSIADGESLVKFLLSALHDGSDVVGGASHKTAQLVRSILHTAQEPHITGHLRNRPARQFVERFYDNLSVAREAVLTQLEIRRLGVGRYRDVIGVVNAYQGRCIARKQPGMFGWLALSPLLLFLRCLTADSNYVTFFWAAVQYIEAFARFPGVRAIEAMLISVVERIHTAAHRIARDLAELAVPEQFSVPALRRAEAGLGVAHNFLTVLLRVELECENVAVDSHMAQLPPVMASVQRVLSADSESVLEVWAALLEALTSSEQVEAVRRYCLATTQHFALAIEDLVEVSAKKDEDERLNAILDVCDDFFDALGVDV